MFDSAACAHPDIGAPQVSVDALVDLRALLMAIGSDSASARVLTEEDCRRASKTRFKTDEHAHAAAVDADDPRCRARRVEAKRSRRVARKTVAASRAGAHKRGAER